MGAPGSGKRGRHRVRVVLLDAVGRPLIFALWAFALWGTFVALCLVASAFEVGPREALIRLFPGHEATAWSYLNAATVLLAFLVWTLVGATLVLNRRAGTPEP